MDKKSKFWERFAHRYGVDEQKLMKNNYSKFVDEVKKRNLLKMTAAFGNVSLFAMVSGGTKNE